MVMSHIRDLVLIESLIGSNCQRTLACNSIKIGFNCENQYTNKPYLWIDAPWEFQTDSKLLTASSDYPDHEQIGYEHKFKQWSIILNPLNNTVLKRVIYNQKKELQLEFKGNYYIYVPYFPNEPGDATWYEHWYAKNSQ